MDKQWNVVVCRLVSVMAIFGLLGVLLSGCGSGEDDAEAACVSDRQCSGDRICVDGQCTDCECEIENGEGECVEGGSCEVVSCDEGYVEEGGECIEEDVECECEIENGEGECVEGGSCEVVSCDEGYVEEEGECVEEDVECECEIENGEGEGVEDGSCEVVSCDEGYVEEGGECVEEDVECECEIENGEGSCDEEGNCVIAECDPGYSTEDEDPETGCECAPTDVPDPENFTDANCDGFDGDASRAVFVSPIGDDDDDGVPHRPVRTINRAIDIASDDSDRDHIYLDQGIYEEVLRIEEAVNIYGGFRETGTGDWDRDEDTGESIITGRGIEREPRPVQIAGIEDDMEIQRVTIEAADGELEEVDGETVAGSSVAVTLVDNEAEVTLSHVTIEAGEGMDAMDSPSAQPGATGADGEQPSETPGGEGGFTECDFSEDTQGGDGGRGGYPPEHSESPDGIPGDDAPEEEGGGSGGFGGSGKTTCEGPPEDTGGGHGGNGAEPGSRGEHGGSTPVTSELEHHGVSESGAFILYRGNRGSDGTHGESGNSGGGGGGSGGNSVKLDFMTNCEKTYGRGGGGGGAGGCGGEGAEGGQWGGASVGVMMLDASVSIVASTITTAGGGDGADGAVGGAGGDGGEGAEGALMGGYFDGLLSGGNGGDGRSGGNGGNGSGGEGGPSVGILHENSEVDVSMDVSFEVGPAGEGGVGPTSADGSSAGNGPTGIWREIWGYDD